MLEALAEEPSSAGLPIAPDALWDAGLQGLVVSQHFVFGHGGWVLLPEFTVTLPSIQEAAAAAAARLG